MGILDEAVDIKTLGQHNLWAIYGKSGSGKTKLASTFPKPMLYLRIGDDGSNTIANEEGISAIVVKDMGHLKELAKALIKDKSYASVVVDTFGMITNEWQDENVIQKKKKMTQQTWGDLKVDTEEFIRLFHKVSRKHCVVLTCHETTDIVEGMEDEILPDIRPSVTKGARTYLEGMCNYGIHTLKITKEVTDSEGVSSEVVKYAAELGANAYYWTKLQIDSSIKLPKRVINPSYAKFIKLIGGNK